jgi:hypothetical protein
MTRKTWKGSCSDVPESLDPQVPLARLNRALDDMHDLRNSLQLSGGREWYHDDFVDAGAVPLENSFSDVQRYGPASRRLRYDVRLWSTVDARKRPLPQIAEGFRKMAQFLEAQAACVDQIEVAHKRHEAVEAQRRQSRRATRAAQHTAATVAGSKVGAA